MGENDLFVHARRSKGELIWAEACNKGKPILALVFEKGATLHYHHQAVSQSSSQ